ncbi:hypothetical protein ATN84_12630 [Paramesorhizobium deserti]|uniref:DHFR domain-containing protein n=2 Tax=Paramesorhizobium deserti TaxID=1494590 RepID=A0A135HUH5_9HYPH|nr:hypothetical protein ATN84_12630 [Paramesorhizobium deserti]
MLADYHSILLQKKEFFIIGGEEIYNLFMKYINKVFLTEVFCGHINGDAKFDVDFDNKEWRFHSEKDFLKGDGDQFPFRISCLIRRKPLHRLFSKEYFMGRGKDISDVWDKYVAMIERSDSDIMADEQQLDFFSDL